MSNQYFQFKQFTVQQEKAAMKVCTDACIFGAYIAAYLGKQSKLPTHILDIGSGTGLLSLMLAQVTVDTLIDAIEIDAEAFQQTKENFEIAPWPERLQAIHANVLSHHFTHSYDGIISNPPFFENDLKSVSNKKNAAKHNTTLTILELISIAKKWLKPTGFFAVVLPYHRVETFEKAAAATGFFTAEKLLIRQTPAHAYFRGIVLLTLSETKLNTTELIIKNEQAVYTHAFVEMLRPFYLHL